MTTTPGMDFTKTVAAIVIGGLILVVGLGLVYGSYTNHRDMECAISKVQSFTTDEPPYDPMFGECP